MKTNSKTYLNTLCGQIKDAITSTINVEPLEFGGWQINCNYHLSNWNEEKREWERENFTHSIETLREEDYIGMDGESLMERCQRLADKMLTRQHCGFAYEISKFLGEDYTEILNAIKRTF